MERHGPIPSNKQVLASTAWSYFGERRQGKFSVVMG